MRQIKFRVWDKKNKPQMRDHDWLFAAPVTYDSLFMERSDIIVMQFTGLKDKNGKEIYSDDVLLYADGLLYQVVWHNQLASFGLKHPDGVRFIKFYGEGYNTEDMTIKGNIYENPDLLK